MRGAWMLVVAMTGAAVSVEAQPATDRVRLAVDGGLAGSPGPVRQQVSLPVYLETARLAADLTPSPAALASVGARVSVGHAVSVGATVTFAQGATDGRLQGTVPHPFYFGAPRSLDGAVAGLQRRELALHAELAWTTRLRADLALTFFGGPSFFRVHQDLVASPRYTESFPYDTIRFDGATQVTARGSGVGAHGGLELTWRASPRLGVAALGRYARGPLRLAADAGRTADGRAGGPHLSAGIRLFF